LHATPGQEYTDPAIYQAVAAEKQKMLALLERYR
jgi:hypothetical protein